MISDSNSPPHARLFTRSDCSLCERARRVLDTLAAERLLTFESVDVDGDPLLAEQYGRRVPVVELSTGQSFEGRISEYRLRKELKND
jgi:glutaredoxin